MKILFAAVDAQYFHTNLAVRSVAAYIKQHAGITAEIAEFTINHRQDFLLEKIYRKKPEVLVFSCYIWNVEIVCAVAKELRKLLPDVFMAAAGPQVSYHCEGFLKANPAFDAVLAGEGEESTKLLLEALQAGRAAAGVAGVAVWQNNEAIIAPRPAPLALDALPFAYTEEELASGRILYYESMRGCPFGCSYCLSSVERGVRYKSLGLVFEDLARFLAAKPKQVKFVDRTFNCSKERALEIWRFLQQNDNGTTNFHFELAGELLDKETIGFLNGLRPGLFQFEIGVQSANVQTLQEIDRPANLEKLFYNIAALQATRNIHLHLDLIAGLPFEDYASFVQSFNMVYTQKPNQFQLGFLKVLAGSGMESNAGQYGLVWQDAAPFEVLYTKWIRYEELLELKNIADMVELYYNSGRFSHIVEYLAAQFDTPFAFYRALGRFYLACGHDAAPLSKIGHYQLLGDFMDAEELDKSEYAQWLCKLDLARHEKIKALPGWVKVDLVRSQRRAILDFYENDNNTKKYLPEYNGRDAKQLIKMAHIEVFPFNPLTGEEKPCSLLFNYQQRDIEGRAMMWEVEL